MLKPVRRTINEFTKAVEGIMGEEVLDVCVYGSTVTGDFRPGCGDIDFIVFLTIPFTDTQKEEMMALHDDYRREESLFSQLEGTYYCIDRDKIVDGLYIGSTRKGWQSIKTCKHSYLEQAMILQDHIMIKKAYSLERLFTYDWQLIKKDICRDINFYKKGLYHDINYLVAAIHGTARSIYTLEHQTFTSKSHAIENIMSHDELKDYHGELKKIKQLRYPIDQTEYLSTEKLEDLLKHLIELFEVNNDNRI
jgi:predicted nucleotidyltransferase